MTTNFEYEELSAIRHLIKEEVDCVEALYANCDDSHLDLCGLVLAHKGLSDLLKKVEKYMREFELPF